MASNTTKHTEAKPYEGKFSVGDKVTDRDGFRGVIVRHYDNRCYEVRLASGITIRFDSDLVAA